MSKLKNSKIFLKVLRILKEKNFLIVLALIFGLIIDVTYLFSKEIISFLIKFSFFILIFLTFLNLNFEELKSIKKFLKPIIFIIIVDYLIFPIILLILAKFLILDIKTIISLLFLILAPTAISSIYIVSLVKGNKEEELIIVLITHLLFLVFLPLILYLYKELIPSINFNIFVVIKILSFFILLPLILAFFIQKSYRIKAFIKENRQFLNNFQFFLLLFIIFATISLNFSNLSKNPLNYISEILIIIIYFLTYFFLSHFLLKIEEKNIYLSFTYKNYVITLLLLSYFEKEYIVLPLVYVFLVNLFLVFYLRYYKKNV
ncbi:MAG: hypothetical protein ABGW69_02835 [Nanoarchaeota archaeon]